MQTKNVTCPKCRLVLGVKSDKDTPSTAEVVCPQCHSRLLVRFKGKDAPLEAHTSLAQPISQPQFNAGETQLGGMPPRGTFGRQAFSGETQLGSSPASGKPNQEKAPAVLPYLLHTGRQYNLKEGKNIIGRKALKSEATIQIDTNDKTMSRQHCSIDLKRLPDGTFKAVISNYKNLNLTKINNVEIADGDIIRLSKGDMITMGETTIVFNL